MPKAKRSAVALRHVAFEDLGLLAPILARRNWSIEIVDAPTADLSDPRLQSADLLVVLGGPIGVYETQTYPFLSREIALIERRLRRDAPTLGLCLGCQAMANALGGAVYPGPVKEIGWGAVELTAAGRRSALAPLADPSAGVLHWHGDTFDLPHGATRLASNGNYANQAFSWGKNSLALQFHIEVDPRRLELWLVGHAAELAAAEIAIPALRAATLAQAAGAAQRGAQIFDAWLDALQLEDPSDAAA